MILFNFNGKENICEYIKDGVKNSVLANNFTLEGNKYGVYNQCSKEFLEHLSKDLIMYDLKSIDILMSGVADGFLMCEELDCNPEIMDLNFIMEEVEDFDDILDKMKCLLDNREYLNKCYKIDLNMTAMRDIKNTFNNANPLNRGEFEMNMEDIIETITDLKNNKELFERFIY